MLHHNGILLTCSHRLLKTHRKCNSTADTIGRYRAIVYRCFYTFGDKTLSLNTNRLQSITAIVSGLFEKCSIRISNLETAVLLKRKRYVEGAMGH